MNAHGPILLVEDNPDDVFFMQRACKTAAVENPVHVAEDGNKAIEYLSGAGEFADRDAHPLPCLILLDLKLPGKSGLEVLAWLRARAEFGARSDYPQHFERAARHPRSVSARRECISCEANEPFAVGGPPYCN
jgi:CheY-like chemotaxis protein